MPKAAPNPPPSDLPKLSAPAQRALAGAGITSLKKLSQFTQADIARLHGLGPKSIRELQAALSAKGLAFKKSG
jgi:DNA-directed RNA polymerase alpha subunit